MPDDFVQVQPDSTGKKLNTFSHVLGANTVHDQRILFVDESGNKAKADANGNQLVIALASGGPFIALPAGPYTNGVALTSGTRGVEITSFAGGTVSYTVQTTQPVAAPPNFRTVPSGITDQIDVNTANLCYITATTGAAGFYRST